MSEFATVSMATQSPEQTRALGESLARAIQRISLKHALTIALNGELGTGKTTFVGGLLRALGVSSAVRSPTYTLIEPYELGERTVYHLDLYRIVDPRELEMLGLRDLLAPDTVLIVEWAERGATALPTADLTLNFRYDATSNEESLRQVDLKAGSLTGNELAVCLQA